MKKGKVLPLSNVFFEALSHLPLEYNYALYSQIFENFGTHYFTAGSLGGMYDLLYQYSREELKNSGRLAPAPTRASWRDPSSRCIVFILRH